MTPNQIAELRELLPPIARGDSVQIHRESYERAKELTLKLLDERDELLALLAEARPHLGIAFYSPPSAQRKANALLDRIDAALEPRP